MQRLQIALLVAGLTLAGCAEARAVQIDPQNDSHCATLMMVAALMAKRQGAPEQQSRSIQVMDRWYSAKLAGMAKRKGADALMTELKPLMTYVDTTPFGTHKQAMLACVDRALGDPNFNSFAQGRPAPN